MKKTINFFAFAICLYCFPYELPASPPASGVQDIKNVGKNAPDKLPDGALSWLYAKPAELKWFEDAKFGIFICWGPCSLKETEIGWGRFGKRPGTGNPAKGGVPEDEYDSLYKKFNPVNFDADTWVKMIRDSGAKYMIFLTKHHDGFCMFDAKNTDYKITNTPYGKDVTKMLADACHKYGVKIFWYYSQPDWHHPDYLTKNHDRYRKYMYEQVRQLLTEYGKIDGIWFDCLNTKWRHWDTPSLVKMIRELQPGILINSRWGWGMPGIKKNGDFDNPEQKLGMFKIGRPWETCYTMGLGWSWRGSGNLMSPEKCIRLLINCTGSGGNLALDCGPRPDGTVDPAAEKNYLEMGRWLKCFGYSIYATRGGPYKPGLYGVSCRKEKKVFIHLLAVFSSPSDAVLTLPALPIKVASAEAFNSLMDNPEKVPFANTDGKLNIDLKGIKLDNIDTVITLSLEDDAGSIKPIDPALIIPEIRPVSISASSEYSSQYSVKNILSEKAGGFEAGIHRKAPWIAKPGSKPCQIIMNFDKPVLIGGIKLEEPRRRVNIRGFELQYYNGEKWETIYSGNDEIGIGFSLLFPPVSATKIRLNLLKFKDVPSLSRFSVYKAPAE